MNFEDYVIKFFNAAKLKAKKIPESDEKTPDFLISDEVNILVELKEKNDSTEAEGHRETAFSQNKLFEHTSILSYRNRLSGIIGSAAAQLKAQKEKTNSDFCFVFVVMNGISPNAQFSQFASTLYGKKNIFDANDVERSKECYYFTHSEFYKYSDIIDGAFLVLNGYMELLINDKSPRYEEVINSKFVSRFSGCIIDPKFLAENDVIFYADTDLSRKDEDAVKAYVFEKYGIDRGFAFDFPHYSIQSRLSLDDI